MANLRKMGPRTADMAVVEMRKVNSSAGVGFDTRALSLLAGTFEDAGYNFSNVASYSLTFNSTEERNAYIPELKRDLKRHKLVITLGAMPMQLLCRTKKTLGDYTGSLTWNAELGIWVIPSYHPSSVFTGPWETMNKRFDEFDFLFDHIHRAVDIQNGVLPLPDPAKQFDPCPRIFVGHRGERYPTGELKGSWSGHWEATREELAKADEYFQKALRELDEAQGRDEVIEYGLDTESRGLNHLYPHNFIMIQIYDGRESWAFTAGVAQHPTIIEKVREFLHHPQARFILTNTQHDRKVLRKSLSVDLGNRDIDTLCLALGITEKGNQTGLKYQARQLLNAPFYEEDLDEWLDKDNIDYSHIPPDVLADYGNKDVYYSYHLKEPLLKRVAKEGTQKSIADLLMPGQRVFADLSYEGVRTDLDKAKRVSEAWGPTIESDVKAVQDYAAAQGFPQKESIVSGAAYKDVCECVPARGKFHLEGARVLSYRKILREAKIPMEDCTKCDNKRYVTKYDTRLNVNSSAHMQHLCFDILRMRELPNEGRSTKKQFWKMNANHPLAKLVAEYKEKMYLRRNFLDAFPRFVKEDGRMHPNFLLFGTKTGRLAVREPAMQTIPTHGENAKVVKECILPDDDDSIIINVDYKSLEMFIAHHLTKDPVLLDVLLGEWDAHTALAAKVYGKPPANVTPEERQSVKPVNFGAGYGISGFKLAMDPAMEKATGGSPDKAQAFLDEFWSMYSVWNAKCDEWRNQAMTEQYLTTEMGRKRRWNLITGENANKVKNQAMNFKGQSLASDLCLSSLIKLHYQLKGTPWGRVMFSVHDSIVFSIKKKYVHEAVSLIKEIMTDPPFETDTPFFVDVECGLNYGNKEPYDSEKDYTAWQFA